MRIPLAVTRLSDEDVESVQAVLRSGNLTMGNKVREFEEGMAAYLKVNHFVMVNSGSSANLIALESLIRPSNGLPKFHPGDGVLVPSIAWPTTIWPLIQLGLIPIFVDVNSDTLDINLDSASNKVKNSQIPIRGIFPIHPLGFAIDHEELDLFAETYDLVLLNDVCESLGSWNQGIHAGTTGSVSTFSFYFSHHITTMEGGGIATNCLTLADDLRSMRSHGWSRDRSDRANWTSHMNQSDAKFRFVTTGYNVRPTEVQAAIGIGQIANIDKYISRRREIVRSVSNACHAGPLRVIGAQYLQENLSERHSWMLIPLEIIDTNVSREKILSFFESRGVETRPVLTGNFLRQPAMNLLNLKQNPESFPISDWVAQNCLVIGCHHDFTDAQVGYLIEVLSQLQNRIE